MVGVAQLVEPWIVIPVVVGSSPIVHPILKAPKFGGFFRFGVSVLPISVRCDPPYRIKPALVQLFPCSLFHFGAEFLFTGPEFLNLL